MPTRREFVAGIAIAATGTTIMARKVAAATRSEPFSTSASHSSYGDKGGSTTSGLRGTRKTWPDGRVLIVADEELTAWRKGGFKGAATASCRRELLNGVWTITQSGYAYRNRRALPPVTLWETAADIPPPPASGFRALEKVDAIASQFGKGDHEDEGTGDPSLGLVQTDSEVFGAAVRISIMVATFGDDWKTDARRLGALIDVYNPATRKAARMPVVDVGPGENIAASVDLTWASDRFLRTDGQAHIRYRLLLPI